MKYATIRTSASKARDAYGYTLVTLTDITSGKAYRTCGGGYDMLGVVLADWLADTYQAQLQERLQGYDWQPYGSGGRLTAAREIYGAFRRADGSISIDGACGVRSVQIIAEAAGLKISPIWQPKRGGRGEYVAATIETNEKPNDN